MKINTKQLFIHTRKWYMARTKGTKEFTVQQKNSISDLTDVGAKQYAIVQHFGMLQSTVANIIRRRNETNNEISERRGCNPKLTPRCIRSLLNCARENRFKPLLVITSKFNEFREVPVNESTVRRVLKQQGISNYVAVCKPFLTRNHEKRRLN